MLLAQRLRKDKPRYKGNWGSINPPALNVERISVSAGVYLPDATLNRSSSVLYDGLGMSRRPRSHRRQQMASPVGRNDVTAPIPVISSTGMRKAVGIAAAILFCFLLAVGLLVRMSDMTELSKNIETLQARIVQVQAENETLEDNLAQLTSEVNVGYEAVRLGMISAKGADVIYLMAPETRDTEALLGEEGNEVAPAHSEFFAVLLGM